MRKLFILLLILPLVFSCKLETSDNYTVIDCPESVRERAFNFAMIYKESDTKYKLGGQDPCRSIMIDCSGLVIMCYKYAMVDTNYNLLVNDMAAAYIAENASTKTETPIKGDLIFMGESGTDKITHIAIFEKEENGFIYFIDSTQKDTDGDGVDDIDGVTERFYSKDDDKIKSYGIMRVKQYD